MFLFERKKSLAESAFFSGFEDCHSHILPGVDDGFTSVEDSLSALSEYEKAGVSAVWLTPHIMEDIPNPTGDLRRRFDALAEAYRADRKERGTSLPAVHLHLGSENMLDTLFEKRLGQRDVLPLPGDRLLVETSYYNPPYNMDALLDRVRSAGFFPVLAHPERYIYMSGSDYTSLRESGVFFQANVFSFLGYYGDAARDKAEFLLKNGFYSFSGTDLHRMSTFLSALDTPLGLKTLNLLKNINQH